MIELVTESGWRFMSSAEVIIGDMLLWLASNGKESKSP